MQTHSPQHGQRLSYEGFPIVEVGVPKVAWFKRSKNSARNCSDFDSVIRVSLMMEKSRLDQEGPVKVLRPRFPGDVIHGLNTAILSPTAVERCHV